MAGMSHFELWNLMKQTKVRCLCVSVCVHVCVCVCVGVWACMRGLTLGVRLAHAHTLLRHHVQDFIDNDPDRARQLFMDSPQLAQALLHGQVILGMLNKRAG